MATLLHACLPLWVWVKANPWTTFFAFYAVLNVLYAQLPKPKNPKLLRIWELSHWMFQVVLTNAKDAGTLTWPGLLRSVLRALAGVSNQDFDRPEAATNPGTPGAKRDSLHPVAEDLTKPADGEEGT